MNRVPVESSNIHSVGYDPATQTLEVQFKNNTVYQYADVPADLHAQLIKAESVGKFFNAKIKNSFAFTKLQAA